MIAGIPHTIMVDGVCQCRLAGAGDILTMDMDMDILITDMDTQVMVGDTQDIIHLTTRLIQVPTLLFMLIRMITDTVTIVQVEQMYQEMTQEALQPMFLQALQQEIKVR